MPSTGSTAPIDEAIRVVSDVYPSGMRYLVVYAGKNVLGHVHRVDGGYVRWGAKKPRTLEGAIRDLLISRRRDAQREVEKFEWLLGLPVNVDAVDPVVANQAPTTPRD